MAFIHPSVVAGVQTEPFGPPHSSSGLDARSAMIPGGAVDGFAQLMKALAQAPLARRQQELRQKEIDRRDQLRQDNINERARHDQSMEKIYAGRGGLKQKQIDPYKRVPRKDPNSDKIVGYDLVLKTPQEIADERKTRAMLMGEDDGESNEAEPDDDGRPDGQPAAAPQPPASLVGALGPAHAGSWLPSWLGGGSPAPTPTQTPAAPQQDRSNATGQPQPDFVPPSLAAALPPRQTGGLGMAIDGPPPAPVTSPKRRVSATELKAYAQKIGKPEDEAADFLTGQGHPVEGFDDQSTMGQ